MAAPHRTFLLSFPNELLHETALYLEPQAVNAFMRANSRLHNLLAPLHDRLLTQNADRVLSWAARNKKERFFELALSRGAHSHRHVSGSIKPPLFFAVINGWDSSVKLLVRNGAHSIGDSSAAPTALHAAVLHKHISTTRLLLNLGWSLSVPSDGDIPNSLLHDAIRASTNEIIELLITRGANINGLVADQTTLEVAAQRPVGGLAVIKLLLMNGFDMSIRDSNHERAIDTAFREAVKKGDGEMAKFLLESGADIKSRSPVRYETVLHTAIRLKHWPIVEVLLESGMEINARNREKETALFGTAIGRSLDDPARKFFLFGDEDGMLHRARPALLPEFDPRDRLPVMKLLLDAGIDVNARDYENNSVLFRAVCHGCTPIVELLLQYGADIHAQNGNNGSTALHAAAGCGDVSVVQVFLANGSDINAQTNNGSTALHIALGHGDTETANVLIDNGIDISIRAKILSHYDHNPHIADGANALYLAVRWGHEDLAKLLLRKGAPVDIQYNLKLSNESHRTAMVAMFEEVGLRPTIMRKRRIFTNSADGEFSVEWIES